MEAKDGDSKEKKNEIKEYNKWREKERKTELPPIYQPLMLNCDFLTGLANELKISPIRRKRNLIICYIPREHLCFWSSR